MQFTEEYQILKSFSKSRLLELKFHFNGCPIRLYYHAKNENEFLVLICEINEKVVVRNLPLLPKKEEVYFNGYWGNYYDVVKNHLRDKDTWKFTEFYSKLSEVIKSLESRTPKYEYTIRDLEEGLNEIREYSNRAGENEKIYFLTTKRQNMTDEQYKKTCKILGETIANTLRDRGLTTAFTSDIRRQKTLILN